jgi:hypothetical protein
MVFMTTLLGSNPDAAAAAGNRTISEVARIGAEAFPSRSFAVLMPRFPKDKTAAVESHANADGAILTALGHDLHRRQKVAVAVVGCPRSMNVANWPSLCLRAGQSNPFFSKTLVPQRRRAMLPFDDPIQLKLDLVRRFRLDDRCAQQRENKTSASPRQRFMFS